MLVVLGVNAVGGRFSWFCEGFIFVCLSKGLLRRVETKHMHRNIATV